MKNYVLINEKYKELIKLLNYRISHFESGNYRGHESYIKKIKVIESELSELESEPDSDHAESI